MKQTFEKVLVIGSGPIVIGQAAEFDYSGSQCLQVLKENNIKSIILNSNPATIMTDEHLAHKVYMEPMTVDVVQKIIIKEKPDAILSGFGGQTALNLTKSLAESGFLNQHNVTMLGSSLETIKLAEDRQLFRDHMVKCGFPVPKSEIVESLDEGKSFAEKLGYPVVVRPAFTLGGSGGGIAFTPDQLINILERGLMLSPVKQCLLEQSILGFKEIEFEVLRDEAGNAITVCGMENIDPVGIHTGDSLVVAPILTLTDRDVQMLRSAALNIAHALNIIGGCNVQLAISPNSNEYYVIEVNPRVSRSSALASKATGYPIAKIAASICLGKNLTEIINPITQKTFASHEPAVDYVILKIPRWPFDKFVNASRNLGTQMKATGEIMSIGRNFEEALLKGIRSLEIDNDDLIDEKFSNESSTQLLNLMRKATDERLWQIAAAFRKGVTIQEVETATGISTFFLHKISRLVFLEKEIANSEWNQENLHTWKKLGFGDHTLAKLKHISVDEVRSINKKFNLNPVIKTVDTCSAEFTAATPYFYQTWEQFDEFIPLKNKKIVILGSGPIRIGQGIEFDYASVHALLAAQGEKYQTIMINNNPETCSTDFTFSDQLYFEPLHESDVFYLLQKIQPDGVFVQFGGQTAINLANKIHNWGHKILGTSAENIKRVENRELFDQALENIQVIRPKGLTLSNAQKAAELMQHLKFPVIVRPSYVLGGRQMSVCYDMEDLQNAIAQITTINEDFPVLVDEYINGKEIEVDVLSDGIDIYIPGIMEHIERAGVHSGDSIAVFPTYKLLTKVKEEIIHITKQIAREFQLIGIFNMQFTFKKGALYLLEVNPRASRTVPFISKMINLPVAQVAAKLCLGKTIKSLGFTTDIAPEPKFYAVKVPVFSFEKIPDLDPVLEAEMKSTGEVLGRDKSFEKALYKGLLAQGVQIPQNGRLLVTISDRYKEESLPVIKEFYNLGFEIFATAGTAQFLFENGIRSVTKVHRISQDDKPNIKDLFLNKSLHLIINTLSKGKESNRDGFAIRRMATERNIPCFTSLDTAAAVAKILTYMGLQLYSNKDI
jgi:carbamoyl-phosphate synthase large subunit